jgi:hypothetical protein
MASVLLYWVEVKTRDLPRVCMTCGEHDAEWAPRRLRVLRHRVLYRVREWMDVELPFCPNHYRAPFIQIGATRAWDFTNEGVMMVNVAEEFVDALEHYRDTSERREEHKRRKRRRQQGLATADDVDVDAPPPPTRRPPKGVGAAPVIAAVLAGLGLVGVVLCMGGLFCTNLVIPKLGAPGPAPGGPAFPAFKGPVGPAIPNPQGPIGPIGPKGPR